MLFRSSWCFYFLPIGASWGPGQDVGSGASRPILPDQPALPVPHPTTMDVVGAGLASLSLWTSSRRRSVTLGLGGLAPVRRDWTWIFCVNFIPPKVYRCKRHSSFLQSLPKLRQMLSTQLDRQATARSAITIDPIKTSAAIEIKMLIGEAGFRLDDPNRIDGIETRDRC